VKSNTTSSSTTTTTTKTTTSPAVDNVVRTSSTTTVYYNKVTGHLYWATWLKPSESVTIPFKYKITWPAEETIVSVVV